MKISERRIVRSDVDVTIESEVLAEKGEYALVERLDPSCVKYGVLRKFGDSSYVLVGEYSGLVPAGAKYDELIERYRR